MRKIFSLLTVVLIALISSTTSTKAQGPTPTPNPDCKPADVITKAAALKSTGDTKQDMAALVKLSADIEVANIACNGMTWSGKNAKVLGPFDLPQGTYKVTATTAGFFIAQLKAISGDCSSSSFVSLYNLFQGQATEGAETTIDSSGCRATITLSDITAAWKLTIEPLQ